MRKCANSILLLVAVQFSHCLLKRLFFFPIVYTCLLCHRLIDHKCMGLFLGSLFCSIDIFLFSCQYHPNLMAVTFKSGSVTPPVLFFLLKFALAIQGLLCFPTNFRIINSSSVKKKKKKKMPSSTLPSCHPSNMLSEFPLRGLPRSFCCGRLTM